MLCWGPWSFQKGDLSWGEFRVPELETEREGGSRWGGESPERHEAGEARGGSHGALHRPARTYCCRCSSRTEELNSPPPAA